MWEFEIVVIEKTAPPQQQPGNWYRYTIANRITEISGLRRGSRDEVAQFVCSSVQRLNTRHKAPTFSRSRLSS